MANPQGSDRTVTDGAVAPPRDAVERLLDDQRQSWLRGQRTRVEEYLQWMPHLASDPVAVVELLVGEYRLGQRMGDAPQRAEFEQRFPEHATQLRQRLVAAGMDAPDADLASNPPPAIGPGGTVVSETTSEASTQVGESRDSSFTLNDPTEHGDSPSQHPPTALIEASEALARELAERHADGRAGSLDRSTIVHLIQEVLQGPLQSRSKRRAQTPVRAVPGYDILAELGRGAVGVVYKARQAGLNRIVALKMILAGGHASRTTLARFRAEAEAVASLQHGNIVQVYEIGECDGLPFFSLEFCAGGSLADRLDGTPLPPDVAARTLVKIARAMHYAHGCKVVHRDLKPGNILLHPKDDSGRPPEHAVPNEGFDIESVILKVSDFGLAKRLDEESQTKTGAILGTPSYMAPEQASGQIHNVGPSADIYALGAVLYELLTGRPPFRAANALDTVVQVMHDDPVPPRRLQSGVPADLETIALKCLQKDPQKRYATAADLADDVQRFLDGEPIVARPIGTAQRAWRWCRRNPLVASLSGLAALLLVAGTVVSLYFAKQATDRAAQAEINEQRAKAESESARHSQYVAEMNLVQRAWRDVEMARVRALLQAQVPASDAVTDFRGPEWHYWNRLAHSELAVIPAEVGESPCLAMSPDGLMLAAAASQRMIIVWNVADWRELARFTGHSAAIVGLAFLPDGRLVSAGTAHGVGDRGPFVKGAEIRVWSIAQSKDLNSHVIGGEAELEKAAVSSDGTKIAIADRNGSVTVANIADGSIIRSFEGAGVAALCVAFSPDNRRLAAGFANGDATVWNIETGATLKSYHRPRSVAHCVAFSPEGQRLAIGGSGIDENDAGFRRAGDVRILSLHNDRVLADLRGHTGPVLHVEFSADGHRVVTGGNDRTVRIWDALTSKPLTVNQGHERATTMAVFAGGGRIAISAGDDHTLRVWDASEPWAPWPLGRTPSMPQAIAIRPDGRMAAIGYSNGDESSMVEIRQLPSNVPLSVWPVTGRRLQSLAWHPTDGTIAVVHSAESTSALSLRKTDGAAFCQVDLPLESASKLLFSRDGSRIGAASSDRVVIVDANSGRIVDSRPSPSGPIAAAAFRSNNEMKLVSLRDGKAFLWDAPAKTESHGLNLMDEDVVGAAVSRDRDSLATVGANRTIRLWGLLDGQLRAGRTLTGHVDKVADVEFSPDGLRLASSGMGYDHTTRLWDAPTGQELLVLVGGSGDKPRISFADNGHWLAILRDRVEFLDFRPLDAANGERAVLSAARHYFNLAVPLADAAAALNSDRGLPGDQREAAAGLLSQWAENSTRFERSIWLSIRSPYANEVDYRKALSGANHETITAQRHGFVLKGAALFRSGQFHEARKVLSDGGQLQPNDEWERVRQVFLALTLSELGRAAEAATLLQELERRPTDDGAAELIAELRDRIGTQPSVHP